MPRSAADITTASLFWPVIARSESDEAIQPASAEKAWIASLALAMTPEIAHRPLDSINSADAGQIIRPCDFRDASARPAQRSVRGTPVRCRRHPDERALLRAGMHGECPAPSTGCRAADRAPCGRAPRRSAALASLLVGRNAAPSPLAGHR